MRQAVESNRLNTSINPRLKKKLILYANQTHQPLRYIVEEGLKLYFDKMTAEARAEVAESHAE